MRSAELRHGPVLPELWINPFQQPCAEPGGSSGTGVCPRASGRLRSSFLYGGFWIRLLAHLIDHLILSAVAAPLFFAMVLPSILRVIQQAQRDQEPSPEMIITIVSSVFVYVVLAFVGQWLYEALLTSSSWQATIGKRVLHLKVIDEAGNRISFGRATGRFFAKILSSMFMCIGFIMIAFTERKTGLHDMLAGTRSATF